MLFNFDIDNIIKQNKISSLIDTESENKFINRKSSLNYFENSVSIEELKNYKKI